MPEIAKREGFLEVGGGEIWYRVLSPVSGSPARAPLLFLHGGPGVGSDCFRPFDPMGAERTLVFYDQLGGGRSTHDMDPRDMTVEKYVADVGRVREALGLSEVHLLGHSWGTQLAAEYLRTNPEGVKSVTFASPSLNTHLWAEDMEVLLSDMPNDHEEAIRQGLASGDTDNPAYQKAMQVFNLRHLARRTPWSDDLVQSSRTANMKTYHAMWGTSDFAATGVVKDLVSDDVLADLTCPVLFTTGRYDGARPETCAHYQSLALGSELHVFEESAHVTMHDQPEESLAVMRDFLARADQCN